MTWDIGTAPLVPIPLFAVLALAALAVALLGFWAGSRAAALRTLVLGALILVLINPVIREEEREPVPDLAVIVADDSLSQRIGLRKKVTEEAVSDLRKRLEKEKGLTVRVVTASSGAHSDGDGGTELFAALEQAARDVPPETIAGAFLVTDGQVHDVPEQAASIGFDAPVHTLLTGRKSEADRRLTVLQAPPYGIVGERLTITLRIDDHGGAATPVRARVRLRVDGQDQQEVSVRTGQPHDLAFELAHGGSNVIEIEVEDGPAELTRINNRAVVSVNGIRDRLRVLLVSGEPHPGERTWRNLLKADPSVDLVHFTILRPVEKQHWAMLNELSLIEFPVRELFEEKLYDFDLIIFDRYRRRDVLPANYFENVARYVEKGGALLVAAGPAFASQSSVYRSALAGILPAQPSGRILRGGFRPEITEAGARHPVTAALRGSGLGAGETGGKANWGRWFRLIASERLSGRPLMTGLKGQPVLVLDRVGKGRVAQLMSDHAWLWTRGFEGGGPQAELLRRLAHWLMKEPDLEEEDLRAAARGQTLEIRRRTMADQAGPAKVETPGGETVTVALERTAPGLWSGQYEAGMLGLYRISDGELTTVTAVGPLNPREFADVRTSDEILAPFAKATGSGVYWIADNEGGKVRLPALRRVRPGRDRAGGNWMALHDNGRYVVKAHKQTSLLPAFLALLLCLGGVLLAWRREGQ